MSKVLHFIGLLVVGVFCCGAGSSDCITKDGYFRGIKLAGRVQIVTAGEDFRVRLVTVGEDLKVRIVDTASKSDGAGRWRIVQDCGDFKVKFVDVGEDFRIRFDDISCGVSRPCKEKQRPR